VKLYSPKFERALRRGFKRAIRRSPELKQEYKRAGRNRGTQAPPWVILVLIISVPVFLVYPVANLTHNALSGLALMNLLAAFAALFSASALWSRLHAARDLAPLFLLPVDDSSLFRWKIQQALKTQALFLPMLIGCLTGIGVTLHFSFAKYMAIIPIGLLTWLTQLAVVVLCAARMPRRLLGLLILGGMLTPVALIFSWKLVGLRVVMVFERGAPSLNVILPTSWPLSLFQFLLPAPHWIMLALLLPMGILLCTLPSSMRLLRREFGYKEVSLPFLADLVPDVVPDNLPGNASSPSPLEGGPRHLGETAIADIILSRQFLAPPLWPSRGPMERWFWRWLDKREKALADLVFPAGVAVSAFWRSVFRMVAVVAAAGLLTGLVNKQAEYWVVGIGLAIATLLVLATLLGTGQAFRPVTSSGVSIPMFAAYGVGFKELSDLLLKFSLVQLPPLLAFTMAGSCMGFYLAHGSLAVAIGVAFKLAFVMLASRFIVNACRFSGCTSDNSGFRLRAVAIFFGAAFLILAFMIGGITGLVFWSWLGWGLCGLAALAAFALHRFYRWFYYRNYFDLMSLPRR
jgi:hypothetical protein